MSLQTNKTCYEFLYEMDQNGLMTWTVFPCLVEFCCYHSGIDLTKMFDFLNDLSLKFDLRSRGRELPYKMSITCPPSWIKDYTAMVIFFFKEKKKKLKNGKVKWDKMPKGYVFVLLDKKKKKLAELTIFLKNLWDW